MKRTGPGVLLLTTVLGLAGCGSGSGPGSPPVATGCPTAAAVAGSNSGPEASPPGDIPDDQTFVAFSPAGGRYTVKVPEGWARTEPAPGRVTFTDKLNRIDIQMPDAPVAPTVESTTADVVPALAAGESCFSLVDVKSVTRPVGSAVLSLYRADSAPDPVTGKVVYDDVERYSYWKDGTEVVLTLAGPAGSDNVDPWRVVTDSFAWRP
jgi:hypothetical protein